ncbi:predicted protein [Streptomyces iranensis]|uniref:Uncharacterized protein n=1 Tax=Streptomyces iranensis TaxID=576784 RepID=A0A061A5P5_9ACTN|nr:predicted protein [Streptomyces iranensis]
MPGAAAAHDQAVVALFQYSPGFLVLIVFGGEDLVSARPEQPGQDFLEEIPTQRSLSDYPLDPIGLVGPQSGACSCTTSVFMPSPSASSGHPPEDCPLGEAAGQTLPRALS